MARAGGAEAEERVEKLRTRLDRGDGDPTDWFMLGRALLELSRWREAADAFRRAIALDPRYTAAHRDLGRALLEAGEVAEAASVLGAALELARERGDLQTGREMETFLRRAERILGAPSARRAAQHPDASSGEPRAAAPDTRPAPDAATHPQATAEARALYRRGFEHFANDRHDEAIALYEQALRIDPALAIAWNGLSLAHRQKGELEAAIAAGRRLVELEPDDALGHTNLSILYMRRGMIPEAEEEKAIAMQLQMKAARRR